MLHVNAKRLPLLLPAMLFFSSCLFSQTSFHLKFKNSLIYAGIEVGSKGVKMSVLEVGKSTQKSSILNILKDTSVNTDFISFSPETFSSTLNAFAGLYNTALKEYSIPSDRIFSVMSSGVRMQAEKESKTTWINTLSDSFINRISEPSRQVPSIDVLQEARLSHLGIVPEARRYSTFLIDIGSGNAKGGYFPGTDTKVFKLFQLNWGTKSTANAAEKRSDDDKSFANYNKQLYRVLNGAADADITYAVNESGAYSMSDYVAFSGGISWSIATLLYPELADNPIVPITYPELVGFIDQVTNHYSTLSAEYITRNIKENSVNKEAVAREIKKVNQVFDQRSLLAGSGLLLKIMRQFEGVYEKKQFYLVKNGQVGWISAYVNAAVTPAK